MDVKSGLFYLFAGLLLFAAFRVITARNPVHAVLYLVMAFFQAAAVWILLKAEFLAITLVLVYVGAVMVLFLFVVMMLDVDVDSIRQGFWKHFPLAGGIGALIALEMATVLIGGFRASDEPKLLQTMIATVGQPSNTKDLGKLLYTSYLYPMQVAAIILLVAVIAAIALTLRERKDTKHVAAYDQVRVQAKSRMTVVAMAPTLKTCPPVNVNSVVTANTGKEKS
jgi:NADH-quinone oxidoreductase subunit J